MLHHQTFLHCSRRTALLIIGTTFLLFVLIGCAAMLRKTQIPQDEADRLAAIAKQNLAAAATEAVADIQEGLAQGQDLKSIAVKTGSAFTWKLATIGASTIGAVLSGLLAKWLGTERKITTALITGIEKSGLNGTKQNVQAKAKAAGVQNQLDHRVQALT